MTDSPIEDREANIRMTVESIVDRGHEAIYENLDRLHKRNIHDRDVMKALRSLGFGDVADGYEDWAEIEPEDDNTTMNPVVPDPGDATSYATLTAGPVMDQALVQDQLAEAGAVFRDGKLGIDWGNA